MMEIDEVDDARFGFAILKMLTDAYPSSRKHGFMMSVKNSFYKYNAFIISTYLHIQ